MNLHENKEVFEDFINIIADEKGISPAIIEKDYFVTYILGELVKKEPAIIFKGGTSLSKCYKLINRFSEDIDLNYDTGENGRPTEGTRRNFVHNVEEVIISCGMKLINEDEIRSKRFFNRFEIDYNSTRMIHALKPTVVIETALELRSFPAVEMDADSYIYQYLLENDYQDIIKEYNLYPFKVKVQSLERTFIDKVFAVCDYYLNGTVKEHSRHLYDLYKIFPNIDVNESLIQLINDVRELRKQNVKCLSAKDNVNPKEVLNEIIELDIYQEDYNDITKDLLFEDIEYSEVIETLKTINETDIFNLETTK